MGEAMTVPVQLHVGAHPSPWSRLRGPHALERSPFAKPRGVLWTTSWETAATAGWLWWLAAEGYAPGWPQDDQTADGWLLTPSADARVFTVDGPERCEELHERFGREDDRFPATLSMRLDSFIDWDAVSDEYDGVRLTAPYHPDIRWGHSVTFYGWDAESTAWFRWAFDGSPTRVPHKQLVRRIRREARV